MPSSIHHLPVNAVLHNQVEQPEGRDERADDGVGRGEGEDEQHPAVVVAEHELVDVGAPHRRRLGHRARDQHAAAVHEQLGEPHELEGGADEGGGDDVVHEEGPVVGEENAPPPEHVLVLVVLDDGLEEGPGERGRGENVKCHSRELALQTLEGNRPESAFGIE